MKYFLVLVFITYIALAEEINSEQRAKALKYKEDCIQETSVDSIVLRNATHFGDFPDDEKLNNFFLCFFKKLGFINEAGKYDVEKTKTVLTTMTSKDEVKLVEDCTKTSLGDGISNAVKLAKCYFEKTTQHEN